LGKDPEVREVSGNNKVAQVPLATTERGFKKADGTEVPERTEWHNLVAWNGLATVLEKYTSKGSKIYVEGKIRTRSYETQAGEKRYITEVFVDTIELLSSNNKGNGIGSVPPPPQSTTTSTTQKQRPTQTPLPDTDMGAAVENVDDDLPF
jgi:single-strand DNA-binding protein